MDDAQRARVVTGLQDIYQAIGHDAFGGEATDEEEFVGVMSDQAGNFPDLLAEADVAAFRRLSPSDRWDLLVREVL